MFEVNRKVEYALIALKHMSQKPAGELTSAREISKAYNIPFDSIAPVLKKLNAENLLKASQGARGGYQIVADLSNMSFADFMKRIVGPVEFTKCIQGEDSCELADVCGIISPMQVLHEKLVNFLEEISLKDLIDDKNPLLKANQAASTNA